MDKEFHLTLYNGCKYLSMLELKSIHESKNPWDFPTSIIDCSTIDVFHWIWLTSLWYGGVLIQLVLHVVLTPNQSFIGDCPVIDWIRQIYIKRVMCVWGLSITVETNTPCSSQLSGWVINVCVWPVVVPLLLSLSTKEKSAPTARVCGLSVHLLCCGATETMFSAEQYWQCWFL